jgi:hypothetical protein
LRHRLLLLNLLLAGLTGVAGWRLRQDWLRDHQHASTVINRQVKPVAVVVMPPVAPPSPFAAPTFADVAQKDLFSKDRNPNVVIPPVEIKPAPKWPRMPILYGVMGLPGGMIAMLKERPDSRSRGVGVGEKIGDLKLVALSSEKISFEFDGQVQEKNVQDLVDRGGSSSRAPEVADSNTSQNPANIAARGGPPVVAKPGVDVGAGGQVKACDPRDTSPAGTQVDGFTKIMKTNPFGVECTWVVK